MKSAFAAFARFTEPDSAAEARVRARIATQVADVATLRSVLAAAPAPRGGAERRVAARLAANSVVRRPPRVGYSYAALAVVAVVLGVYSAAERGQVDSLDQALSSVAMVESAPTRLVHLAYQGEGNVSGTSVAPRIAWTSGRIDADVVPGEGVDLVVVTPEGEVRVVGTQFSVNRDALGTTVGVSRGHVQVQCHEGHGALLAAGQTVVCVPTTAAGLLGRSQALADQGGDIDDVLAAADAGLSHLPTAPVAVELQLVRLQTLDRAGRWEEALAAADSVTTEWGRAVQIHRLAAGIAWTRGGCALAVPRLTPLHKTGLATGPERVRLAECVAERDPSLAREAILAALAAGVPESERAGILERLARIDGAR